MSIRLRLLGGVAVEYGGDTVQLALDRPVTMLIYLALRGDWVRRSELALLYKPDAADDEALAYLRKLVFRARKYDWVLNLEVEADSLRWRADSDVAQFNKALAGGELEQALEHYRGPFLSGAEVPDAPGLAAWLELEREALEASWLKAASARAKQLGELGNAAAAAELLGRMVAVDMLAEDAQQAYMQALVADGRRHEALAAFDRFSEYLAQEVDGEPLESTMVLADSIRESGEGVPTSPARAATLPEPVTSFVGRAAELTELADLLQNADSRLVTIVGLGGSGKTRLAIEAGRRWREATGLPVEFVPLVAVPEPGRLAAVILDSLALDWEEGPADKALFQAMAHSQMLLVLDGFEEVLAAAPFVARLLEAAPGLRVLVTSREPLRISDEWRLDVGGLAIPEDDQLVADESDSVMLFVNRAARTAPRFTATGSALEAIAVICRQLEGMPLAIELAAGWVRLLSVDELQQQLSGSSALLTSDLLDIPERHRSIWRVFDHTWSNLGKREQQVLVRLSVFRGSFKLQAATRVAGADLSLLLGLLDRSLVRRKQEGRFAMHELVRQYAESRATGDELPEAVKAHSKYYCAELEGLHGHLKGQAVQAGLDAISADSDNFEAAWLDATARLDLDALEQAREPLDDYFYYRSRSRTAMTVFGETLSALQPLASEPGPQQRQANQLLGQLKMHLAEKEFGLGEFAQAEQRLDEALAVLSEWGTGLQLARGKLVLANGLVRMNRYPEARARFNDLLAAAQSERDDYLLGAAHNGLANLLAMFEGDVRSAEKHYLSSLEAHRRTGNLEGVTGALTNLGACCFDLDDLAGAERLWSEAVEVAASIGFREREAALLNNLGVIHEVRGEPEQAAASFARSLELRRELGNRQGIANVLVNLGRLTIRGNDPDAATRILAESIQLYSQIGDKSGEAQSRSYLARALLELDRRTQAASQLASALELAMGIDSHRDILGALYTMALLQEAEGNHQAAISTARCVADGAQGSAESLRAEAEALVARLGDNSGNAASQAPIPARDLAGQLLQNLTSPG